MFEGLFNDFGYMRATDYILHTSYKPTTMMLPSLASVYSRNKIERRKKETMPFHVRTDFKHARYAPNTLPSSNAEVRDTEMERLEQILEVRIEGS